MPRQAETIHADDNGRLNERRSSISILWALLIVALVNSASLFGDFISDDYLNLINAIRAGWSWSALTSGFVISVKEFHDGWTLSSLGNLELHYFRPLFLASLLADKAVWGLWPFGYHLTNLALHLATVWFFFQLLRELMGQERKLAWFGALLYGLMPFHAMSVGWISGRTELLPGLAMMVSLLAYVGFGRTRSRLLYALSLGAMALGLLAKENVTVFPLVVAAAWLWTGVRRNVRATSLLPYFALAAAYLGWRFVALGGFPLPQPSFYYHSPAEPGFARWAVAKAACLFYGGLFQLPLNFPMDLLLKHYVWVAVAMLALALAIALVIMRIVQGKQADEWRQWARFAVAWAVVSLLPTAPLLVAPFYFYFPLGGVCLLYVVVWHRLIAGGRPRFLQRRFWRKAIPATLAALFALGLAGGHATLLIAGWTSRATLDRAAACIGQPIDGQQVYAIDLPFIAGPVKVALQLRKPGWQFEFHAITISPYPAISGRRTSRIEQIDERTMQLTTLERPYFSGVFGLFAFSDGDRSELREGRIWRTRGYIIELAEVVPYGRFQSKCVRRFVLRFEEPLRSPNKIFLQFAGTRCRRVDFR